MSTFFTGTNSGGNALEVTDGTTTNTDVHKIIVTAGTITASSGTSVTITTGGGGGGGAGTVTSVSTTLNGIIITNPTTTPAITGTLGVISGGTGANSLTNGGILLGSGTNPITATVVLTNGQLLIGDGAGDPVVATLTAGTGIGIANGAGSITISNTGAGTGTVTDVTAGKDLTGTPNPITDSGTIDLQFDADVPAIGGAGTLGFINPPPPDVGLGGGNAPGSGNLVGGGWVKVTLVGERDAWIPYWVEG